MVHIKKNKPTRVVYTDAPAPSVNVWNVVPPLAPRTRPTRPIPDENIENNSKFENTNFTQFKKLTNEFQRLNPTINIDKVLNLIIKLNKTLEQATNNTEKFVIMNHFMTQLNDDDF